MQPDYEIKKPHYETAIANRNKDEVAVKQWQTLEIRRKVKDNAAKAKQTASGSLL